MTRSVRIAAYNVEWFGNLFDDDNRLIADGAWSARWNVTRCRQAEAVATVMRAVDADIFQIVEAPDHSGPRSCVRALEGFAAHFGLRQRKAMIGFVNDTSQELALLYDPDRATAHHEPRATRFDAPEDRRRMRMGQLGPQHHAPRFDGDLPLDIDGDGLVDFHHFSKPPLEAVVEIADLTLRLIGVHAKSKAPHGARSDEDAVRIQIRNRRKQLAQCEWIRRRVDGHLDAGDHVIVLGDFNDGPGIDRYERLFGRSGVEVAMGDVSRPERLLRNPYVKARLKKEFGWSPSTCRFYDRKNRTYVNALLDFVMLSPELAADTAAAWRIWHPFDDPVCFADKGLQSALLDASDHFPVSVDLTI
ncbi:MAG: endonuclease [Pseudomonadota bacterium]